MATQTQGVFKINSLDPLNIQPSIKEGERFYSSILGPDAAVIIVRFAPTYVTPPTVTGSPIIPSTLTCSDGTVTASPRAVLSFQWKAGGIDIPGEITNTFTTDISYDTVELTCLVTATNPLGFDTALSNGITAEILEPIEVNGNSFFTVNGLSQDPSINFMEIHPIVISGMANETRFDVDDYLVYIGSGMWVLDRFDVETLSMYSLVGVESIDKIDGYSNDNYVMWDPAFDSDLAIVNPDAASGDTTGWTIDTGTVTAVTSAPNLPASPLGTYFFKPGDLGAGVDSQMSQVVVLAGGILTNVDAGDMLARLSVNLARIGGWDNIHITMDFLSAADAVLGTETVSNVTDSKWSWNISPMTPIPTLTRKIEITVLFEQHATFGTLENNVFLDTVEVKMYSDL